MAFDVFKRQYDEKLVSADKAVEVIKFGDQIFYSEFTLFPQALDEVLTRRIDQLHDLQI